MPTEEDDSNHPLQPSVEDSSTGEYDSDDLPEPLQELIQSLPEKNRARFTRLIRGISLTTAVQTRRRGPLPSPDDFAEFERIRPGSADDIMEMAKTEQSIKKDAVRGQLRNEWFRIAVGLFASVGLVGATFWAIWLDQPIPASVAALSAVVIAAIRLANRSKD